MWPGSNAKKKGSFSRVMYQKNISKSLWDKLQMLQASVEYFTLCAALIFETQKEEVVPWKLWKHKFKHTDLIFKGCSCLKYNVDDAFTGKKKQNRKDWLSLYCGLQNGLSQYLFQETFGLLEMKLIQNKLQILLPPIFMWHLVLCLQCSAGETGKKLNWLSK